MLPLIPIALLARQKIEADPLPRSLLSFSSSLGSAGLAIAGVK